MDKIEGMEKPFDKQLSRLSQNQLMVLRTMLSRPEAIFSTREIARKSGVVEKRLGGVLSAMSRKRIEGLPMILPMGRESGGGLRWKLNTKALTVVLAVKEVKLLLASY